MESFTIPDIFQFPEGGHEEWAISRMAESCIQ
jgi:hypothetical protein